MSRAAPVVTSAWVPPGTSNIPGTNGFQNGNGNDSEEEGEEDGNEEGDEVLHCTFPGCLKEFSSRWSLTRHTRTHTGERPFKCNLCGKEFVQKCSLKRHEQTHSQEKQWICDHPNCGKRFKLKEYLDVHKRTHVKVEAEPTPVENVDTVVQDSQDAATALIDQLRQRLVRMSVRHHEQLFTHQQREQQLMAALQECAGALERSLHVIQQRGGGISAVPIDLAAVAARFAPNSGYQAESQTVSALTATVPAIVPAPVSSSSSSSSSTGAPPAPYPHAGSTGLNAGFSNEGPGAAGSVAAFLAAGSRGQQVVWSVPGRNNPVAQVSTGGGVVQTDGRW